MEVNLEKISVTLVGSLPRKQEVVDFIFARENNQKYKKKIKLDLLKYKFK